jgi:hypothetical protein
MIPARSRVAILVSIPMLAAIGGAWLDERRHAGFSQWRTACRTAGLSLQSLASFTWQLLPTALLAALAGAFAVQLLAIARREQLAESRACLAAHAGCVLAMPLGLVLCVLVPSLAVTLITEFAMAVLLGLSLLRLLTPTRRAYP